MRWNWRRFWLAWFIPTSVHFAYGYTLRAVGFLVAFVAVAMSALWLGAWTIPLMLAWEAGQIIDAVRLFPREEPPSTGAWWRLCIAIGVGFFALAGLLREFWVEAYKLPSGSNIPTLQVGDHMFVDKRATHPQRGDQIVFIYPRERSKDFIKRVVAVGGDRIEIRDDVLIINGQPVARTPVSGDCQYDDFDEGTGEWTVHRCNAFDETLGTHHYRVVFNANGSPSSWHAGDPVVVPANSYFVLGDNRDNSHDSRFWGIVPAELVKGTARIIWWSTGPNGVRWDRLNKHVD
jgi:signal peptidase I